MNWFFSIIRSVGSSFPVTASFVQFQSELDSDKMDNRIKRIEDPVSNLHSDIQCVSKKIYDLIKKTEQENITFDDEFVEKFGRSLAILEKNGFIKGNHAIGKCWAGSIYLSDPSYVLYLCKLSESEKKMNSLFRLLEGSKPGDSFDGVDIQKTIDLPIPVIKAFFRVYQSMGYGFCSKTIGTCHFSVTS